MARKTLIRKAFEIYFGLSDRRSLTKLQEALMVEGHRVALRTLEYWSVKYRWQERIADFEREAEQADRAVHIEEIRAMRKRQEHEGQYLQQRGFQALEKTPDEQIPPRVAVSMLQQGAKLEREARGLTSQRDTAKSAAPEQRPHEIWVHLGGPPELYLYPDPDPPDPPALPPTVEGEEDEERDMEDTQEEADEAVAEY